MRNSSRLYSASALTISVLLVALSFVLFTTPLLAQGGEATITGTVNDQTGAVVPAAAVTLVNQGTNESRVTQSNGQGFFSFTAVPPGTYTVRINHTGFSRFDRKDIAVHANDSIGLTQLVLKPGATTTTVEVSAAAEQVVPVDTGEKSETIQAKQVQNLSIIGRNAVELLKILPGVVNQGGAGGVQPGYDGQVAAFNQGVGSFNVNGTRNDALAIVNDGADTLDPGCNCGSSVTPNVDMVQEVKVQTSNFSAENSKGPVVIQTVDKSGTSQLHGEAYYSARTPSLTAKDWQANAYGVKKPKSKFQYPGFNIGGPVLIPGTGFNRNRDKMFFFAGFEWMRQGVDLGLFRSVVPTPEMYNGDFSKVLDATNLSGCSPPVDPTTGKPIPGAAPIPCNTTFANAGYNVSTEPCLPTGNGTAQPSYCTGPYMVNSSQYDKGGLVLAHLLPAPNANPANTQGFNYLSDIVNPQNRQQSLVRIDYNFTQNTKLYSRFNWETEREPYPYGLWWNPSTVPYGSNVIGHNHAGSLSTSLTNVFSPTLTNELVVAITRLDLPNDLADPSKVSRKALGYPYQGFFPPQEDKVPNYTTWGGGFPTYINPGCFNPTCFANKWTNSVSDNLSKVTGYHLMKFGAYYEHLTNDQPTSTDVQGDVEFGNWGQQSWGGLGTNNTLADLLLGYPVEFSQTSGNIVGNMGENEFDVYGQDSWKVKPRLTLDYGARIFHEGWMYDKGGRIAIFDPNRYNPSAPIGAYSGLFTHLTDPNVPKSGFKTPVARVAPHFGFAYDLTGNASTVIRGGFGTYYYRDQGNVFFGAVGNPPYLISAKQSTGGNLASYNVPAGAPQKTSLNVLDWRDNHVPVTYSYSLTLSKRMPWQTVMEASYVGNSSHNQVIPQNFNINVVPEGALFGLIGPGTGGSQLTDIENAHRPFPTYAGINQASHVLTQHYDSLQVTASRQTGHLNYSLAYTFSKTLGVSGGYYGATPDSFDIRHRSYGLLPYDQTHALSIAYVYLAPNLGTKYLGDNAVADGVLNGWQISGISQWRSGFPVLLNGGSVFPLNVGGNGLTGDLINGTPDEPARPLLVCDPTANLNKQQIFNADCFQAPSPGQNGVFQFPYIRGPWYNNTDLSAFKNFAIGKSENRKLQLRLEAFNFDNHPLWGFVSGDPGLNLNFGMITNVAKTNPIYNQSWGQGVTNGPKEVGSGGVPAGYTTNKFGHRIVQLAVKFFF